MQILITISFIFLVLIIIEFPKFLVYRHWLFNYNVDLSNFRLNTYSNSIMLDSKDFNKPYISTLPIPIFCKYYIDDKGQILRFTKTHNLIKQRFKELNQN